MKNNKNKRGTEEMLDEYDFSQGIRGKYVSRYKAGSNVIILDPDIASVFKDSKTVNEILRPLADIIHQRP
jgi:hypothetical protein